MRIRDVDGWAVGGRDATVRPPGSTGWAVGSAEVVVVRVCRVCDRVRVRVRARVYVPARAASVVQQ